MNVSSTTLRVVVMILLASNGLYSMDYPARSASPDLSIEEMIAEIDPYVGSSSLIIQQAHRPFGKVLPDASRHSVPQRAEEKVYLYDYDALKRMNSWDKHPLHKAVRIGKIGAVSDLCDKGFNPVSYNYIGMQPLHYAIYLSNQNEAVEIVEILKNYFDKQKQLCINFLNAVVADDAPSEIIKARNLNAHEILRFFIPNFQPFYAVNNLHDYTDLIFAGDEEDALGSEKKKAQELLIQLKRINLFEIPTRSQTLPLTLAIDAKKFTLAKKLIELGAPIEVEFQHQQPLLLAIKSGNTELIELLLQKGAPITDEVRNYLNDSDLNPAEIKAVKRTIRIAIQKLKDQS